MLLNHIQAGIKKRDITRNLLRITDTLEDIGVQDQAPLSVDVNTLPDDIKDQYSEITDIWYKNSKVEKMEPIAFQDE